MLRLNHRYIQVMKLRTALSRKNNYFHHLMVLFLHLYLMNLRRRLRRPF